MRKIQRWIINDFWVTSSAIFQKYLNRHNDHAFGALGALGFFYPLSAFFSALSAFFSFLVSFFSYYSLLLLFNSSFSFLRRFIVTLAVVATLVANSKAPPAKVTLHPLHFQIPQADLLTWDYIRNIVLFHRQGKHT